MSLNEKEQYRLQVREKYNHELGKRGLPEWLKIALLIFGAIFVINSIPTIFGLLNSQSTPASLPTIDPQSPSPTQVPTPTLQNANPLDRKFRQLHFLKDSYSTIRGVQFHPGEPSDNLVEKIGKPLAERHTTDHEYGLIAEYKYENNTVMIAKIPFIANYFIIYAIYPNEEW